MDKKEMADAANTQKMEAVVDYIITYGTQNTSWGNWITDFNKIPNEVANHDFIKANAEEICDMLAVRDEVLDIAMNGDNFSIVYGLAYCPDLQEEEDTALYEQAQQAKTDGAAMYQYNYYRGSKNNSEAVEFTVKSDMYGSTTCVVNVDMLLCGVKIFPCADGNDFSLNKAVTLDILSLVKKRRDDIRKQEPVKSVQGWENSGLRNLSDYLTVGDVVDEDMVDDFRNSLPPRTDYRALLQMGEPYSHVDSDEGQFKATYTTFSYKEGQWVFMGYCFAGETKNRVMYKDPVLALAEKIDAEGN